MWLNYPNNPTGAVASLEFFAQAVEFCRRYDVLLCHDAAYQQVTFDDYIAPSIFQVPAASTVGVEFGSLSKAYNMAGWRVGFISGNADAVSALLNTKMPNYEIVDDEVVIKQGYAPLPMKNHPVTVTIGKIDDKLIIDPASEEEEVIDSRLSVAFTDDGKICAIQKGGSGYFTAKQLKGAMKLAISTAESQRKKLKW